MADLWETRARIEAGWPEALTVSPEELAELRAHERGLKLKMWATGFAVPVLFAGFVSIAATVLWWPMTETRIHAPAPRSTAPSAYIPAKKGLPTFFKVDPGLERDLGPQGP